MEAKFQEVARWGNVEEAKGILMINPKLDVNFAFCVACENGPEAIVSILLAHPAINVNLKNRYGGTPFNSACRKGRTSCVRLLLKDQRVDVNEPDNDGSTPLREAASEDHLDVIKWWIASGREMDLGTPGDETDAIGRAKTKDKELWSSESEMRRKTETATLMERFKNDAKKTREEVRNELGITGQSPFSLFIFRSDRLNRNSLPIQISL